MVISKSTLFFAHMSAVNMNYRSMLLRDIRALYVMLNGSYKTEYDRITITNMYGPMLEQMIEELHELESHHR